MVRRKSKLGARMRALFPLIVIAGLAFLGLAAFRAGGPPALDVIADLPAIGRATTFSVTAAETGRGLSSVRIEFVQGEQVQLVDERDYTARKPWEFWGPRTAEDTFEVVIGRDTLESIKEGTATVRVTAARAPAWLRWPGPVSREMTMDVKLRPPQLQVTSRHTYVAQGGCETVVYRISGDSVRDGVQVGEWFFPGYPLPGGGEFDRFAIFAVPYDVDDHQQVTLIAADKVDNVARQPFIDRFFAKPFREDTIRLSDRFMERVVPAILAQSPELRDQGSALQNYLMINGELRAQNAQTLIELSAQSLPEFLWNRSFVQMRNAKVMSDFADRRTYIYNGEAVDEQDHLGFDLASTSRADIQAANSGIVLLARYFGIYGNAVVIDHGYGLMSLYGHLSEISVAEGQEVGRGQTVGKTGVTGLAGGDHLHFTMMLQGLAVTPIEWWDGHWIHDRLKLKLGDGLEFRQ